GHRHHDRNSRRSRVISDARPGPGASHMSIAQQVQRYFLTGLAVIVPLWGTYLILKALFTAVDGALVAALGAAVSSSIPGLGALTLILLIVTPAQSRPTCWGGVC